MMEKNLQKPKKKKKALNNLEKSAIVNLPSLLTV